MYMINGKGPIFILEIDINIGGKFCIRAPFVRLIAAPRKIISIASVTIKAFIFSFTTKKPFINPIAAPTKSIIKIVRIGLTDRPEVKLKGTIIHAPNIAVNPRIDSIERSKFPVNSTTDSAITKIPVADAEKIIFLKFAILKKEGMVNEQTIKVVNSNIHIILSLKSSL